MLIISIFLFMPAVLLAMQSSMESCVKLSKNSVKSGEIFDILAETGSHEYECKSGDCEYIKYDTEIIENKPVEKFSFRAKKDGIVKVLCSEEEGTEERICRIKSNMPHSILFLTHFFHINIE